MVPSDARRPRSTVVQQVASVGILALLPLLAYAIGLLLLGLRADGDSRARFLHEVAETQVHALRLRLDAYADLLEFTAGRAQAYGDRNIRGCNEFFESMTASLNWMVGGGRIGPDGIQVCGSPTARLETAVADRAHFLRAAAGAPLVISPSVVSRATGEPTVYLARRLEDRDGVFAGVVQFAVRPEALTEVLLPAAGGQIQVRLVDRNGAPVAHVAAPGRTSAQAPLIALVPSMTETRRIRFRDVDIGYLTVSAPVAAFDSPVQRWGGYALGGFLVAALSSGLLGLLLLRRSVVADARGLEAMVRAAARHPDRISVPRLRTREHSDAARAFAGALRSLRSQQRVLESVAETLRVRSLQLEEAHRLARIGAWTCDPDSGRLDLTVEAAAMLGLRPGERLSVDDFVGLVPEPDRQRLQAALAAACNQGRPLDLVHRVHRGDGSLLRLHQRARLLEDEQGRILLQGSAQDVTEIEASREQAAIFEAALGATDDAVLIGTVGVEHPDAVHVVWANAAIARLTGLPRESFLGPDSAIRALAKIDEVQQQRVIDSLRAGAASCSELDFVGPDGQQVWLEMLVSPILGHEDGILYWVAVGRDATERRADAQRLRASEARYRHLFDDHPLPLWIYDLETMEIVDANRTACEAFGYRREEFVAMRISDLVPPECSAELTQARRAVLDAGAYGGMLWFRHRDGSRRRVEVHGTTTVIDGRRLRIISPIERGMTPAQGTAPSGSPSGDST